MGPPFAAARCERIIRNRRHGGDGRSDPNRRRPAARNSGRPMDIATARSLIELNNRFYTRNAASFSATRSAPWAGWRALSELLAQHGWSNPDDDGTGAAEERRVLDLACGNLRFARSAPWAGWRALSELLAQHGWSNPDDDGTGAAEERRVLDLACGNLRFERFLADEFPKLLSELLAQHGWSNPDDDGTGAAEERRVLDLACGNLRFERFLADEFPKLNLRFVAVDSCAELACDTAVRDINCTYRQIDVLQALLDCDENTPGSACPAVVIAPGSTCPAVTITPESSCPAVFIAPGNAPAPEAGPTFDLCATFGFMHHVPGEHLRRRLLDRLLDRTSPGGLLAMSFWQFMSDDRLSRKADQADSAMRAQGRIDMSRLDANDHFLGWQLLAMSFWQFMSDDRLSRKADQADSAMRAQGRIDMSRLDANDHFLGWQTDPSPLRYCHHFDEREIDELVASVGTRAREVARYSADGSSGTLNRYLVLGRLA